MPSFKTKLVRKKSHITGFEFKRILIIFVHDIMKEFYFGAYLFVSQSREKSNNLILSKGLNHL